MSVVALRQVYEVFRMMSQQPTTKRKEDSAPARPTLAGEHSYPSLAAVDYPGSSSGSKTPSEEGAALFKEQQAAWNPTRF